MLKQEAQNREVLESPGFIRGEKVKGLDCINRIREREVSWESNLCRRGSLMP